MAVDVITDRAIAIQDAVRLFVIRNYNNAQIDSYFEIEQLKLDFADAVLEHLGFETDGPDVREWWKSKGLKEQVAASGVVTELSERVRWEIFERDDFTCKKCSSRRRLTVDHIYPKSKGGTDDPENLQTLCRSCNSGKRDRV